MLIKNAIIVVISIVTSFLAKSSAYPPNYCHQVVRVLHQDAVLIAHVGSGCDGIEILGYKNSGILAAGNPENIDAVVIASCINDNAKLSKTSVITLGREWHGKGYMSAPYSYYSYIPSACDPGQTKIEFAFSSKGDWDSRDGANYSYPSYGFYTSESQKLQISETHQSGFGSVGMAAWDFIVEQMDQ